MKNPVVRGALAIVAGLILAVLVVGIVEMAGHTIFPPPEGINVLDPADQALVMESIPAGAKVAVLIAWFLGSLAGCWLALKIGGKSAYAWTIAAIMAAMSLYTTQMFPHPVWMVIGAVILPAIAALIARKLVPPSA